MASRFLPDEPTLIGKPQLESQWRKDCDAQPGPGHGERYHRLPGELVPDTMLTAEHQDVEMWKTGRPAMLWRVPSTPVWSLYPALENGNRLWECCLASPFTDFNSFPLRAKQGACQELSLLFTVRKLSSEVKLLASSRITILGKDTWSSEAGHCTNFRTQKIMGETNCIL